MNIDFANLKRQYQRHQPAIDQRIQSVLTQANFIMGQEVAELERQLTEFTHAKHAITCGSGTDALLLAFMALDIQPGDEIITTPFSFIATAETIALVKAKPVFVDIEPDAFNLDAKQVAQAITPKTKAILPVSLYGQPADMTALDQLAKLHSLKLIIDGAQSFGSTFEGTTDSALGDISTTSFFPAKPLGCYGDGGAVFTNDADLAEKIKILRVHGQHQRYQHQYIGMGARLDTLQAAILLAKLPNYAAELNARNAVAAHYNQALSNAFDTPTLMPNRTSAWAQYTLRVEPEQRETLQQQLKSQGIPTAIHYPRPLHLQPCFDYLGYAVGDFPVAETAANSVISLPMNAFLTDEERNYITKVLNQLA